MNYRHAFHAGNFADVIKHVVLARILVHLRDKPQPFRVIDTHAGAGRYDLAGPDANRTGEWRGGIGRLMDASLAPAASQLLAPYLDVVRQANRGGALRFYPGSPLIALALMRAQDRLIACELEPGAARSLANNLRADKRAKALAKRRGVVLIDPQFAQLAKSVEDAHRKWATGIYAAWYPRKDPQAARALAMRIRRSGIAKILRVELDFGGDPTRLAGAGLIIVNPPWRLEQELVTLLPALAEVLAHAERPQLRIDQLATAG
jgi:23S rRNA (adenine2030-N6)-methyltransferase